MIYFLRSEQDNEYVKAGWIKIGTTTRLSVRLKQIAAEISHTPTLLGVLDGAYAEERAIHDRYAYFRRHGEWFEPCRSDLLQLIATEARQWDGTDEAGPLKAIKIDRVLVDKAIFIAGRLGIPLYEFLDRVARDMIEHEFTRIVQETEDRS